MLSFQETIFFFFLWDSIFALWCLSLSDSATEILCFVNFLLYLKERRTWGRGRMESPRLHRPRSQQMMNLRAPLCWRPIGRTDPTFFVAFGDTKAAGISLIDITGL